MSPSDFSRTQSVASGRRLDLKRTASSGDKEDRQAVGADESWKDVSTSIFGCFKRRGGGGDVFQKGPSCCLRVSFPRLMYSKTEQKKSFSVPSCYT